SYLADVLGPLSEMSRQQYGDLFREGFPVAGRVHLISCGLQARESDVVPPSVSRAIIPFRLVWLRANLQSGVQQHLVWPDGSENIFLLRSVDFHRLCAFR